MWIPLKLFYMYYLPSSRHISTSTINNHGPTRQAFAVAVLVILGLLQNFALLSMAKYKGVGGSILRPPGSSMLPVLGLPFISKFGVLYLAL
jgi:hypothetical protein